MQKMLQGVMHSVDAIAGPLLELVVEQLQVEQLVQVFAQITVEFV